MARMIAWLVLAAMLSSTAAAWGQEPSPDPPSPQPPAISLPETIEGDPGSFLRVPATTNGQFVKWVAVDPGLNLFPVDLLKDTRTAVVTAVKPGEYRLLAFTAIADVPSDAAQCVISIRGPRPPPTPVPPGPGPTPEPGPQPDPSPAPSPIARVMVLYESSAPMTRAQHSVLYSAAIRQRLSEVCPPDSDRVPAWRFWDKDIDATKETPGWRETLQKAREAGVGELPRVFVATQDGAVESFPLPDSEADFLAMLARYPAGGR